MSVARKNFFNGEDIEQLLKTCSAAYPKDYDSSAQVANRLVEDTLSFAMKGLVSSVEYPVKSDEDLKYLAHLLHASGFYAINEDIKLSKTGQIYTTSNPIKPLTTWNQRNFLLAHLYFLIHTYAQRARKSTKKFSGMSWKDLEKSLFREIWITANSFLIVSSFPDLCNKTDNPFIKDYIRKLLRFIE